MNDGLDQVRATLDRAEEVSPDPDAALPPEAGSGGGEGLPPGDAPRTPDAQPPEVTGATYPLNDTGNGQRFALYYGEDAMNVPRVGWHIWDGKRWKLDPDGIAVRRHGQGVQHRIVAEAAYIDLEPWQLEKIAAEPELRDRCDVLAEIPLKERNREQKKELRELQEQLDFIASLKTLRTKKRSDHHSFAKSSGNNGKIDALLIESTTMLSHDVDELDVDPLTVNTESGLLRFTVVDGREDGGSRVASFDLEPHARTVTVSGRNAPQYITKIIPAEFDPAATCPRFEAFLQRILPDPKERAFLQRWWGLSMTGMPIQKFLYCYGEGANGKSAMATLLRRMLGDYATPVKIESLTGKNRKSGSDATPDLMKLRGARAAITSEPEEGERMQEGKIKEMTGGESMLVRNLHSDFIEITPFFKLLFTGNHKLEIRGTDDGIWRRPLLLLFGERIPEAERDEKLADKIFDTERSGILNWMIDGLIDYLEAGLQEPDTVREATEEYRRDSDPIGDFLTTCCDITGDGAVWTSASDLIHGCILYQLENTADSWTPGTISRRIKDRQGKFHHPTTAKTYTRHKRGVWGYLGIALTREFEAQLAAAPRDSKGLPTLPKETGSSGDPADWNQSSDWDYPT